MGNSFEAHPPAIAQLGSQFIEEAGVLGQNVSTFSGNAFQIADAFGLLGACDGAMKQYISMLNSTVQGLEQLAQLWEGTGEELIAQAEVYELVEQENSKMIHGVMQPGGGR
jgi:hypothetical protein